MKAVSPNPANATSGARAVQPNGLHKLTALGAVLVGVFFLAGAYGHFEAVWPLITGEAANRTALIVPGAILAAAGVICLALCKPLWDGVGAALDGALVINVLALGYFLFLMGKGEVADHPIGIFTGVVACNLVLLLATRFGLVWPVAVAPDSND